MFTEDKVSPVFQFFSFSVFHFFTLTFMFLTSAYKEIKIKKIFNKVVSLLCFDKKSTFSVRFLSPVCRRTCGVEYNIG